jgi:hypothetical protein
MPWERKGKKEIERNKNKLNKNVGRGMKGNTVQRMNSKYITKMYSKKNRK